MAFLFIFLLNYLVYIKITSIFAVCKKNKEKNNGKNFRRVTSVVHFCER